MRYAISHAITYRYDRPVRLAPHHVRLRPRSDATQQLRDFSIAIDPSPDGRAENVDLGGHTTLKLWFSDRPIETLTVHAKSDVETYRDNPFNFILEPWAVALPIDYSSFLAAQLQPYLIGHFQAIPGVIDPIAAELAQQLWDATGGQTVPFLTQLTQHLYKNNHYSLRETGDPYPPGLTWRKQQGSCRDLAVLFMAVCRAVGLAARFVSGYHEGDPDHPDNYLHAWAEVYLPGAGWRGYDPTLGMAVGDRYVALAASPIAQAAAAIEGSLQSGSQASSQLSYELSIENIASTDSMMQWQ